MKILLVAVFALLSVTTVPNIKVKQLETSPPEPVKTIQKLETVEVSAKPEKTTQQPQKKPEKKLDPIKDNPNNCNLKTQYVWADFSCHDKPVEKVVSNKPDTKRVPKRPISSGSGSCVAEIQKYNWNKTVAYNVMYAESTNRTWIVNDNPRTKDYSVGCFQINIYGANARGRPSESQLKNAATNVAVAYKIYVDNGQSFVGQWGVCRSKVQCY